MSCRPAAVRYHRWMRHERIRLWRLARKRARATPQGRILIKLLGTRRSIQQAFILLAVAPDPKRSRRAPRLPPA